MWIEVGAPRRDVNQFDPKVLEDTDQFNWFSHIRLWRIVFIDTKAVEIRRWDVPWNSYCRLWILHESHTVVDIKSGTKDEFISHLCPNLTDDVADKSGAVFKAAAVLSSPCLRC